MMRRPHSVDLVVEVKGHHFVVADHCILCEGRAQIGHLARHRVNRRDHTVRKTKKFAGHCTPGNRLQRRCQTVSHHVAKAVDIVHHDKRCTIIGQSIAGNRCVACRKRWAGCKGDQG